MTTSFLGPAALGVRREHGPVTILDATVELAKPAYDGDHTSASGRPGWERAHIPGSRHADLLVALSDPSAAFHFAHPSPETLAAALVELGVRDGVPVVVYDRAGGIWASRLWWLLDWLGIEAHVLDGGLAAWQAEGHPVVSGAESAAVTGPLTIEPRDGRWIGRADLEAWTAGEHQATVLCALDPASYAGEVPTRYSRRGHIPGTGNLPARTLLDSAGRFRPEPELRAVLGDLLDDPAPIWLYCGGGISATLLGLALRSLGREDVALYDGSLEEWSADASLPLELTLPAEVRELLDRPEFAVLSTTDPDGTIQSSVMWAGRDGEEVVMATKGGRRKVRNIARDPRVTVLVYDRRSPVRYAEIRGTAQVTGEDAHALVDELARRYTGADHVVTDPAEEADRVVLRITPTRVLFRS
ncbi:TIGR03618 family F420-dependent PPOX class oxidoreductase [Actinoplanes rectilineatus]|uniref:TIGR03618 family F420-dependent PPOX class oxidoreductase n=1 Tax=Actinoplanes rectilineatus TaxID=113571 RepID=UPI000A7B4500|nr:TIGR03618 family F420-dependent PPOX class oxidoreductase [Actinoplanes rectilineatus]